MPSGAEQRRLAAVHRAWQHEVGDADLDGDVDRVVVLVAEDGVVRVAVVDAAPEDADRLRRRLGCSALLGEVGRGDRRPRGAGMRHRPGERRARLDARHRERLLVVPGQEVRRLPASLRSREKAIAGTDRDLDEVLVVVLVAEDRVVGRASVGHALHEDSDRVGIRAGVRWIGRVGWVRWVGRVGRIRRLGAALRPESRARFGDRRSRRRVVARKDRPREVRAVRDPPDGHSGTHRAGDELGRLAAVERFGVEAILRADRDRYRVVPGVSVPEGGVVRGRAVDDAGHEDRDVYRRRVGSGVHLVAKSARAVVELDAGGAFASVHVTLLPLRDVRDGERGLNGPAGTEGRRLPVVRAARADVVGASRLDRHREGIRVVIAEGCRVPPVGEVVHALQRRAERILRRGRRGVRDRADRVRRLGASDHDVGTAGGGRPEAIDRDLGDRVGTGRHGALVDAVGVESDCPPADPEAEVARWSRRPDDDLADLEWEPRRAVCRLVIVQRAVGCEGERTTSVQPEVVVVKPTTGGSVTVYVPAGSGTSFSPSALKFSVISKFVVCSATVKLNSLGAMSEPTTTLWTRSFSDVDEPSPVYWKSSPSLQPPALASMR